MNHGDKIIYFVARLRRRYLIAAVARLLADSTVFAAAIFGLAAFASAFLNVSVIGYAHLSALQGAWTVYLTVRAAIKFKFACKPARLISIHEHLNPSLSDDFSTAYSLLTDKSYAAGAAEFPEVLALAHIEKTSKLLDASRAEDSVPFGLSKKAAALAALAAFLAAFALGYPLKFRSALIALSKSSLDSSAIAVSPGDTRVVFGDGVEISAALPVSSREIPRLYVSEGGKRAVRIAPESSVSADSAVWTKRFEAVYEDMKYYFALGGARTREYRIKVEHPAVFRRFLVKYEYPSYTKTDSRVTENDPNLEYLEGTSVEITAFASRKLDAASIIIGESVSKMKLDSSGQKASALLTPRRSGVYKYATSAGGFEFLSPEYRIDVKRDLAPTVEIVSPARDIMAAGDEKIPVVFVCRDDFGAVSATFHLLGGQESQYAVSPTEDDTPRKWIAEHTLDLRKLKPDASGIRYCVTARDAAGNIGRSATYAIEIMTYEKNHEAIISELEAFASSSMDILSAQTAARDLLEKQKTAPWERLASEQTAIRASAQKLASALSATLDKMSSDPYFDGYLMKEYTGIRDDLKAVAAKPMTDAVDAAAAKERERLASAQSRAVAALENLALLAADVVKYQRYADIETDFLSMERGFDAAMEALEALNADALSAELGEISRVMSEIEKLIRDMPQLLPEDFVNSQAARDMDFPSAKNLLDDIRAAAAAGNMSSAAEMMSKMKAELVKMRDLLKKASENLSVRSRPAESAAALSRASGELADIVAEQEKILASTEKTISARRSRTLAGQESILKILAVRQRAAVEKARSLSGRHAPAAWPLNLMENIREEFARGKVSNSQKLLDDVISCYGGIISGMESSVSPSKESDIAAAREISDEEKEISRILKSSPEAPLTSQEKKTSAVDASRQAALKGRLSSARDALAKLAKGTASVPYDTLETIAEAMDLMGVSAAKLSGFAPESGAADQKKVIELLASSSENLSSASQGMGGASFGSRPAPTLRPSGGGSRGASPASGAGGFTGAREEKVELPGAQDYKAPQAFRQDILKYLKEKHPADYEEMIKKYYRRLAE
ncbi:MAG: hypothetical protein CVU77_08875 [Elusimicrobia bacterium HGW-Elusimicrobia-1]|jgi:hypothetical protein|nr:MAG: hypothetical protein CVU77_08875 [Elusimicrobia bacterium HGW-Elusimicrobia-1]